MYALNIWATQSQIPIKKTKKKTFPGPPIPGHFFFFFNYCISEGPSGDKRPSSQKLWLNEFKENTIYEVVGQG